MGKKVEVGIVMPIHNRRDITLLCLRSLSRINSKGIETKIYVVDDGSTDGSAEAIRHAFPEVRVIQGSGDLWYTEGTNVGIRSALEARPDYILAINDDSVFDEQFLSNLVETAEKFDRSVVGPLLLSWEAPHRLFQTAPVWRTLDGGWKHWQEQTVWTVPCEPWKVDIIVGNCVLYPVSVFDECGLMDSRHFPNFGDAEYTPRLKRAGYELIIDPRSRVFCQPNTVPKRLRDKSVRSMVRELIFDLKSPSNLTRTFYSHVRGGPSMLAGTVAFAIFVTRTVLQSLWSGSNTRRKTERPLSEFFANDVLTSK